MRISNGKFLGVAIGTFALLALGCAGKSVADAHGPDVTTPDGEEITSEAQSDAAEACLQPPRGMRAAASEADFHDMIVGNWLLCATPSVFGTTGEVGLAIYEDFRWAKLTRDADGRLHGSGGWNQEGSWESLMNGPGIYQLNLSVDGSGTVITVPKFAEQPAVVRLSNIGIYTADYIKL